MDRTYSSILIVDDLEENRDLLSRRLSRVGYTVACAACGSEALVRLEHEAFDLVLLDIMMPEMDGIEVLERIRSTPSIKDIPVIMVSALRDRANVVKCISLGANDYIAKPFDILLLKSRIWRSLEGGSYCEIRPTHMETEVQGRILLVDDNAVNIDLLSRRMASEGHRYAVARDGLQALEMLREHAFDLVLLDIHMPELDGIRVLEAMKADPDLAVIPVIMVSADHDPATIHSCMASGADDFVTKPFNSVILRSRINPLLKIKKRHDLEVAHNRHLRGLAALGASLK